MPRDSDDVVTVAETFGEVARVLAADDELQTTLRKIVNLAVQHLDSCEFAGICLVEGRNITSPASSNDVPRELDRIQSEVREGPCIDAIKEEQGVIVTGDLRREDRWPQFSARAHEETGIVSVLALSLFIGRQTLGALNLYSTQQNAFDETDVALGTVFAVHAAVAMQAARREETFKQAIISRDVIGQAKGILMARSGIGDDEAFDMLKSASQRMNVKLRNIAERIVEGKSLGPPQDGP